MEYDIQRGAVDHAPTPEKFSDTPPRENHARQD